MNASSPVDERKKQSCKIFNALKNEDFELLAEATQDATKKDVMEPCPPYIRYLNLFAKGYRTWQISYNYTEVRNYFYAAKCQLPAESDLARAFYCFTDMLTEYTWCENSFINNDPFALAEHAQGALKAEEMGLELLKAFRSESAYLKGLAAWLTTYFEKNVQLHTGLYACATVYGLIFEHGRCPEDVFSRMIGIAQGALQNLNDRESRIHSTELASELNAHIRIIKQHQERTTSRTVFGTEPTFLRLQEGSVTLCLSAGCDPTLASRIVESRNGESGRFRICLERNSKNMALG